MTAYYAGSSSFPQFLHINGSRRADRSGLSPSTGGSPKRSADIYFKGADVKVAIEPVSTAVLCVGHWDGTTGDDWAAWLDEFENLQLLVSDLGSDLLAAADILGSDHCP